jgi:molecular chaperone HscC
MEMTPIVGIDLGTTFSALAYLHEGTPRLIPNALGDVLTPSVVGIDLDGQVLVGRGAKELQVLHPDRCASVFKRFMGTDWTIKLNDREFTPDKLSSLVLQSLKRDAEAHFEQPVDRAVITVPAYFNEHQRKATIRAGQMAGWKVERILNEPTAAAIAYGLNETDEERILVVFDLGGGTFDVSVVEIFEGTVEVRASSGETFLGGEDFTTTLAARILESRGYVFEQAETKYPKLVSRLKQDCEQVKRRLSRQEQAEVRIPDERGELSDNAPVVTVTREQFQRWTEHILNRLDLPVRRTLGDAQLKRDDVQELILVGGATRMPAVAERVTQLFGRQPSCRLNPDEVVALGAAVQAGLIARDAALNDLVVTDVSPFTLGIGIIRELGGENRDGYFLPIINRNTTIPVSRVERVNTVHANQTSIGVRIYQGEGRRVENNLFLGEFSVEGIPRGPAGQPIDVRFTYDLNGVLEVEATIVETKKKISHLVTRHAKIMSEKELQRAVAEMQALKTHPREETINRFLIRRAERVYQELPMLERRLLESLLTGFEESLELRDKSAIERNLEALQEFLERFDTETPNDDRSSEDERW